MMKMIATQKMKVTGTVNHEIMIIVFNLGRDFIDDWPSLETLFVPDQKCDNSKANK